MSQKEFGFFVNLRALINLAREHHLICCRGLEGIQKWELLFWIAEGALSSLCVNGKSAKPLSFLIYMHSLVRIMFLG